VKKTIIALVCALAAPLAFTQTSTTTTEETTNTTKPETTTQTTTSNLRYRDGNYLSARQDHCGQERAGTCQFRSGHGCANR